MTFVLVSDVASCFGSISFVFLCFLLFKNGSNSDMLCFDRSQVCGSTLTGSFSAERILTKQLRKEVQLLLCQKMAAFPRICNVP